MTEPMELAADEVAIPHGNMRAEMEAKGKLHELLTQAEQKLERAKSVMASMADFAVGNGDVCDLIARRLRAAINELE